MKALNAFAITALAFAAHAWLMPQVISWHFGQNIRECAQVHVGINPNECYYCGDAAEPTSPFDYARGRTMVARELRYKARHPMVNVAVLFTAPAAAYDVREGEGYREVTFSYGKFEGLSASLGVAYDPAGQPMEKTFPHSCKQDEVRLTDRTMGTAMVERSSWYPLAAVAAVPVDFLIDPVLSVASAPVAAYAFTGALGCNLLHHCWSKTFCK